MFTTTEKVSAGYGTSFKTDILETAWRLAADSCGWSLINYPTLSGSRDFLPEVVPRAKKWPEILSKGGIQLASIVKI